MPPQKGPKSNKRKRSAVGGNDDPYGNAAMNAFLKGYQRITCAEACERGDVDLRHVTVWFRRAKKWEQHRAVDLLKGQDVKQSICRALVTRLYGWTPWQYESLRDTFDDASSKDVMGIYANRRGDYAIVGRLPVSDRLVRSAIGIGGIVTGVGGMLLKEHLPSADAEKKELANSRKLNLQLKLAYFLLPKFANLVDDKTIILLDRAKLANLMDDMLGRPKFGNMMNEAFKEDLVDQEDRKKELLKLVSTMQMHFFEWKVQDRAYMEEQFNNDLQEVIKKVNERYEDGSLLLYNKNPRQSNHKLMTPLVKKINLTSNILFGKPTETERKVSIWTRPTSPTEEHNERLFDIL
jgi:hypothetical protein